jgi:RNA polymerase sigma-70 factor (ECF subfamily)
MRRKTESHNASDAQQLRLLASADQGQSWMAFENIFNKYQTRIYRMALKYLRSKELAEEVVQDIFLNLWINRTKLGHVEAFNAYLLASARNMMKAAVRKILTSRTHETEYASNREMLDVSLDHTIHRAHCRALIDEAMKVLSPQQHEMFRLAKVQGLSLDDVAEEMNISKRTVKNHLTRAMKSIRKHLQSMTTASIMIFILFRGL